MRVAARLLSCVSALSGLAACATAPAYVPPPHTGSGLTFTEQFGVQVIQAPDQIELAPQPGALSPAQVSAVAALAQRWRESGEGAIRVQAPAAGSNASVAAQAAQAAARVLQDNGVPPGQIVLANYDAAGRPSPTVAVGYVRSQTVLPECPRYVGEVTLTFQNKPAPNFGCAVTANFAAQLASPSDVLAVRPEAPGDGARRAVVLGKYREGQSTASTRGADERGVISNVAQ